MADQEKFHFDIAPSYNGPFNQSSAFIAEHSEQVYNGADIAWVITGGVLVALQIAGISLLHSGLCDRRAAISMFRMPILTCAVVGCQWFLFGYSLAFAAQEDQDTWTFWGGTSGLVFHGVLANPVGNDPGARIPEVVYAFFQQMFASFTACIVSGAVYRKVPTVQFLCFILVWTTLVYDPVARWSWHPQGWSRQNHSLDFAGGTVVHITSGAAVQAFATWYGLKIWLLPTSNEVQKRLRDAHLNEDKPHNSHNTIFIVLGTMLMYIGWFGFNGGSALGANTRAAAACMNTQFAASFGAVTGLAWYAIEKKWGGQSDRKSATVYFCDGLLNGLVAITPAAGYVPPELAPVFGVVAASAIIIVDSIAALVKQNYRKHWLDVLFMQYDVLHIGIVHAGSGLVGMFLTAFLNRPEIFALDGFSSAATFSHDVRQLRHQLLDAVLAWLYSFFVTFVLLSMSTAIKWILSVVGLAQKPWTSEKSLEVLNKHAWAAGEAQVEGKMFELSLQPPPEVNPAPHTPPAVTANYRMGTYHLPNGGPTGPVNDV